MIISFDEDGEKNVAGKKWFIIKIFWECNKFSEFFPSFFFF